MHYAYSVHAGANSKVCVCVPLIIFCVFFFFITPFTWKEKKNHENSMRLLCKKDHTFFEMIFPATFRVKLFVARDTSKRLFLPEKV